MVLGRLSLEPNTPSKIATALTAAKAEQRFAQRWLAWDCVTVTNLLANKKRKAINKKGSAENGLPFE